MSQRLIGLIDPAVDNEINLGDHIISEGVRDALITRCGFEQIVRVPSIHRLTPCQYLALRRCSLVIVGGTNLLSSNMDEYNQWKIDLVDTLRLRPVVLLGVGWWQYQRPPNEYTRLLLNRILDRRLMHAVRDDYTARQLAGIGITNVVNTSCPSAWSLTPDQLDRVPCSKGTDVITTLTCYNRQPTMDRAFLDLLRSRYRRVYFWPQGDADREYAETLHADDGLVSGGLDAFDRFLESHDDLDYVGTRLHAGIRALQKGRRTLVLGIDNRAWEIARDTGLPVVGRDDPAGIDAWIHSESDLDVHLPWEAIEAWVRQFNEPRDQPTRTAVTAQRTPPAPSLA